MSRFADVTPFLVMDILREARNMPDVIHFEVGEPDIPPSPQVVAAMVAAMQAGKTQYTESLGLLALRERIAAFYQARYQVTLSPERIVLTVGTSGAFLITYAILLNAGDQLLLTDPAYPCYKNFAAILDLHPLFAPIDKSTDYQLTAAQAQTYPNIKAIQIASPANPIGNVYQKTVLKDLITYCDTQGIYFISDEIYHGLVYDAPAQTALTFSDNAIVINGFSKYFSLPGLRLGWVILPPTLIRKAEIAMQNLYISAPTLSQYGALAAFDEDYLERIATTYRSRRDYLYQALSELFVIDTKPQGAFYIWADVSQYSHDSFAFSKTLLNEIQVATTPGIDFGKNETHRYLRFSYTRDRFHLQEGIKRLKCFLTNV